MLASIVSSLKGKDPPKPEGEGKASTNKEKKSASLTDPKEGDDAAKLKSVDESAEPRSGTEDGKRLSDDTTKAEKDHEESLPGKLTRNRRQSKTRGGAFAKATRSAEEEQEKVQQDAEDINGREDSPVRRKTRQRSQSEPTSPSKKAIKRTREVREEQDGESKEDNDELKQTENKPKRGRPRRPSKAQGASKKGMESKPKVIEQDSTEQNDESMEADNNRAMDHEETLIPPVGKRTRQSRQIGPQVASDLSNGPDKKARKDFVQKKDEEMKDQSDDPAIDAQKETHEDTVQKKDKELKDADSNLVKDGFVTPVGKRKRAGDAEDLKQETHKMMTEKGREEKKESLLDTEERATRKRQKVSSYQPDDFVHNNAEFGTPKNAEFGTYIMPGRGKKIREIKEVKANIDNYSSDSEEMTLAHKLLYKKRGRVSREFKRRNIMEFNGYLRKLEINETEEEVEEEDEEAETEYSCRAFKLHNKQLKVLCDFFAVDRKPGKDGKALDKEGLIDRLLDFLGEPAEDLLLNPDREETNEVVPEEKHTPPTDPIPADPKPKDPAPTDVQPKDPTPTETSTNPPPKKAEIELPVDWSEKARIEGVFYLLREHEKGNEPSDAALRQWVQAYVACFDMESASVKHCIKVASLKFGVDLKHRREDIREFLVSEV